MIADDERKATAKAQTILGTLTPTTARTDEISFALQYASRLAASAQGLSSDAALNNLRSEAVIALNTVAGSLDTRTLTQDMVDHAKRTIASLLSGLETQRG